MNVFPRREPGIFEMFSTTSDILSSGTEMKMISDNNAIWFAEPNCFALIFFANNAELFPFSEKMATGFIPLLNKARAIELPTAPAPMMEMLLTENLFY